MDRCTGGQVERRSENVIWADFVGLHLTLHLVNHVSREDRCSCRAWEAAVGSGSEESIAVSSAKLKKDVLG